MRKAKHIMETLLLNLYANIEDREFCDKIKSELDSLLRSEKADLIEQVIETLYGKCGLCEKGESCLQCDELRKEIRGLLNKK